MTDWGFSCRVLPIISFLTSAPLLAIKSKSFQLYFICILFSSTYTSPWESMRHIPWSWGNWEMYLRSHSPSYLKSHGNDEKYPVTGKREISHLFWKRIKKSILGTTNQSASPLCLVRSWNRSSWKLYQGIWMGGRWSETANMASQWANNP